MGGYARLNGIFSRRNSPGSYSPSARSGNPTRPRQKATMLANKPSGNRVYGVGQLAVKNDSHADACARFDVRWSA